MSEPRRETGTYGRLNGEHRIAVLANRQHGPFSLTQLGALGLSQSAVHKRVKSGRLHRVHRGVYSVAPPELLSLRGQFMAAVLACGPEAALSHRSAAHLHGLRQTARANIDVTTAGPVTHRHDGIDAHSSTTLTAADVTTVDAIPCTTVARTVLDLGDVVPTREVERSLEEGDFLEIIDFRAIEEQLERNPTRQAALRLREAMATLRPDTAPTDNAFGELLLATCRRAGVPEPQRQLWIDPGDGEPPVQADFAWPEHKLIVETDGAAAHRTRHRFEADRRRDQRLAVLGWRTIRITWRQLTREPARVERLLRQLLLTPA